ncbi:MAG: flavodoxin family protein [Bacteroidales bacterium]|nr:flavodoxin family protein [Bacteroidales bacterium]
MKALLINTSPHKKGCTFTALSIIAKELEQNNIETEIIHIGNKDIRGCIACDKCKELGRCVFDDVVNQVATKFEMSDGIVIGTPVYYASANGSAITFFDRLFHSVRSSKRMKVGAAISSARRAGTTATLDLLNKYFLLSEMPVASSCYWNMVHGNTPEEVLKDEEGLQIMRVLGRNMAFLIKAIHSQKEKEGLPLQEQKIRTNFIR